SSADDPSDRERRFARGVHTGCDTLRHQLDESKVEYLGLSAIGHKNIRRLNIAMNDPLGMGDIKRVRNLNAQSQYFFEWQRFPADVISQRLPFDELHGDKGTIEFADVIDRANAGMVQVGGSMSFTPETFERLGIMRHIVGKELQGDRPVEPN